jgi:hypothetical protein
MNEGCSEKERGDVMLGKGYELLTKYLCANLGLTHKAVYGTTHQAHLLE